MSTAPHEWLPIAVRAWPDNSANPAPRTGRQQKRIPYKLLVIDTETTTDPSQRLTFGSAKVIWIRNGKHFHDEPKIEEEVIFYADDLPERDPAGYQTLVAYCAENELNLISQADFIHDYVVKGYQIKGRKLPPEFALTFFNAPFDISRLACNHGLAKGNKTGGFAFYMKPESSHTIAVKHLDSKKSLISGAQVLDFRTLVWAMTNKAVSLDGACKLFQVPEDKAKGHAQHGTITPEYIDYNRQDVTATCYLALAVLKQYDRHPVDLSPLNALSPASMAKAYDQAMGIPPLSGRKGIPADPVLLGNVMSAYYGGRAECHIRNTVVPVSVLDFTSMYATVNALLGLWRHVTAREIEVTDETQQIQAFLDSVTLDDMLRPETWPCLRPCLRT